MPTSPAKYEGPFKKRALAEKPSRGWLSPWRLYSIGAIAALGITAFYLLKLTFTPDMIRAATEEPSPPPEVPRGSLNAYCLAPGGGALSPVPPAPFCTEARAPACRDGHTLQLTYNAPDPNAVHLYTAVVTADLRVLEGRSRRIRPGAVDAPAAQWMVRAARKRTPAALVGLFSREALEATEITSWFEGWRRERLLSRPPALTPSLTAKGTTLSAFLVCLGQ